MFIYITVKIVSSMLELCWENHAYILNCWCLKIIIA